MEAEITRLKAREKKLCVALAMTWVAIAIVWLQKMHVNVTWFEFPPKRVVIPSTRRVHRTDRSLPHFTIRMHYGGTIKGTNYLGGSFGYVDYCEDDELSIIELGNMLVQMGQSLSNFSDDYYVIFNERMTQMKKDSDVLSMSQLVDRRRLVNVYSLAKVNAPILSTQSSQNCSGTKTTKTINNGKRKMKEVVEVETREYIDDDSDTNEYDPDSESSNSDDEEFNESDYELDDDDGLLDTNVEKGVQTGVSEHAYVENEVPDLGDLADLDGESEDTEEFDSGYSSSDTDDGRAPKVKKKKNVIFNEKVDMVNPVFSVGMDFKTHAIFRDAVKQHSIKLGKKIKFVKSDRKKVQAVCYGRKACPWFIYAAYVKANGVFRVKHYINNHTCTRSYNVPWISTKWIVRTYSERIAKNPTWPIQSLVDTIESEWTVHVHYQKVFRATRKSEVTSVVTGLYGGSQDSQGPFNSQVSSVGTNMAGGSQPKVPVTNQMHAMPWRGTNVYFATSKTGGSSNNAQGK
ncbi:hypothetical protein Vadar_008846 [Vaccinium darrowii]|uniref:Uncharacterized protein n=1 Tax=Vaccinium darrowii TaxID=229202 RepID=A0ACB7XYD8_9ERIC|nr:hypothetical protein Vadar_008846 [Vaccinium darrowii]